MLLAEMSRNARINPALVNIRILCQMAHNKKLLCCFQTFEFNVPWEQIRECALDVAVMDFDTIGRNELIGQLYLAGR